MKKLTKEWIEKAEKDFLVAEREIRSDSPVYDAICFHSQQCVEKYLKAVLQEKEVFIEKTHDLGVLGEQVKKFLSTVGDVMEKLERLSEYAVEIRYPGIDATKEEAEESFSTCCEVRKMIREYLGLEVEDE